MIGNLTKASILAMALVACSGADAGPVQDSAQPDGLIVCTLANYDGKSSITVKHSFVLKDGNPLRYSQFQNTAFPACPPDHPGCRLEIDGNMLVSDWTAANGTRTLQNINLDDLSTTIQVAKREEAMRDVPFEGACTRSAIPDGIQYR